MIKIFDKKDKNLIIAFVVTGLVILSWSQVRPWLEIQEVKKEVSSELIDPESATFRNIEKVGLGYCGEVNSKNRMGGYVGFQSFNAYESIATGEWVKSFEPTIVDVMCN